ncbi:hypothetical protein E4O03_07785 [Treponema sp. OMZ 792]|uniref:hypothetical protein n=1 Tax=unclassified Treponema TaxID=2638727 RepID=UPI0020A30D29|nr:MULTISPECIES: hypothetical protein [unclassified Treponema]UTC74147.1 hypothetical protein E4O03_07785 [Treponema sp. OMZ 792]UTC80546.1 hypothetical protein E4O07_07685 [Treponema sp. OMZ 798]
MLITNFAGGEVSKNLYGRIDLPIYQNSVSRLENFDIMQTGGIKRRGGTERIGKLKGEARLIPFIVNNTLSFIFEIGPEYIRIWKNGTLLTLAGFPVEFTPTPDLPLYQKSDLQEIQYAQTYDSLYLAHRYYKPYVIKWQGGDTFTFGSLNITGNAHKLPFQGSDNYPACVALFQGRLFFASTIREPQKIWASKVFEYENFTYFDTIVSKTTQLKNPDLRIFSARATKDSDILTELTKDFTDIANITDYYVSGHKGIPKDTKVLSVSSDTMKLSKPATVDKEDIVLSIHLWKNADSPQADDYKDIEIINNVTAPDHAFYFEIGSDKNDKIKWITPSKDLIIGTESSEWILSEGVTAQRIEVQLHSRYGVADFQGSLIGRSVIYIGQGGRTLRDYAYDYQERTYKSIDLTQAASHLLIESKAVDFDYTNSPVQKIYLSREDGTACVLLYDKNTGIAAWSKIILGNGKIKNIVTVPGLEGFDDVYFEVERGDKFYLEKIAEKERDKTIYLDSFSKYNAETEADEYELSSVFIPDGRKIFKLAELPDEYKDFSKEMYIGYEYTSTVESLPVINSADNNKKRIAALLIRFLDSYLPLVSQTETRDQTIYEDEPFSGVVSVPVEGNFNRDVFFKLEMKRPERCEILAVNANLA